MTLSHYSDSAAPIVFCAVGQKGHDAREVYRKPEGLWVSVDGEDDWKSWCKNEGYRLENLKHRHILTLSAIANVLLIDSAADLETFTQKFSRKRGIEWQQLVDEGYHGIIIAPYQWKCRLNPSTSWYYVWDCASGVIWHPDAVESIKLEAT